MAKKRKVLRFEDLKPAEQLEHERKRGLGLIENREKRRKDAEKLREMLAIAEADVAAYDKELEAINKWATSKTG